MPKRVDEKDTIRPVYDLDKLNLVAWGEGYKRRPAIGKNQSQRSNPARNIKLPARMTRQWLASLSQPQLNKVLKMVDDEYQASLTPADRRTCDNRISMILDEIELRRKAS